MLRPQPFRIPGIVLSLMLAGCGAAADAPAEAPLVRTVLIAEPVVESGVSFTGTVQSRVESDLGFRVDGQITERLVSAGERVRRGQVLLRLDATDYALAASAASANLSAAEALSANAQAELKRLTRLLEHGAVSRSAVERIEAEARAAAQAVRAANAQASTAANKAGYANLVADADGVVTEIRAEAGQVVAAGQPLLRLAHDGPRDIEVALPERYGTLSVGFPAIVTFASDETEIAGSIREIAGSADPIARTYRARFALESEEPFALGATARVSFARSETSTGFEIPLSALHDTGRGSGVWVIDPGASVVRWQPVKIAAFGDNSVRVAEGVVRGEQIVSLGAHLLSDGQAVRIAPSADQHVVADR